MNAVSDNYKILLPVILRLSTSGTSDFRNDKCFKIGILELMEKGNFKRWEQLFQILIS